MWFGRLYVVWFPVVSCETIPQNPRATFDVFYIPYYTNYGIKKATPTWEGGGAVIQAFLLFAPLPMM